LGAPHYRRAGIFLMEKRGVATPRTPRFKGLSAP
jgi:hypothetical protein